MIGTDICFDIGSGNMFLWAQGKGIFATEPSVVAYDTDTGKISAIGRKAYEMTGKNPDRIDVVYPVKDGNIIDFKTMQVVLGYYIQKICGSKIIKPNILISVSADAGTVEKRTVIDLATSAGAAKACVAEKPLAAAVGAGADVTDNSGVLVVDMGAGTTDMAVIANGMVCVSRCVKIAGNAFDESIINFIKKEKDTVTGSITAEKIKKQIGCTSFLEAELAVRAVGKNMVTGLPQEIEMTSSDVFISIREQLEAITEEIRLLLENCPPELNADVLSNGIILTGGSANLTGIERFIQYRTGIKTVVANSPDLCVIKGLAMLSQNPDLLKRNACFYKTRQELGYDEY